MSIKIPPKTIISLIITIIMIVVVYAIIAPILTGQQVRAFNQLGDALEQACASNTNDVRQLTIFMPDSSGNTELNTVFYYLAVDQSKRSLVLASRTYGVEKNDYLVQFVDYVRGKPGNKIISERVLKNCLNAGIRVCGQFDPTKDPNCGDYQFEPEEGAESLSFTLNKTTESKVLMSYTRTTVCGDGECCNKGSGCPDCTPQENSDNCPQDCEESKPCKVSTKQ